MSDTPSTFTYDKWSIDANALPPKAIAYLIGNGFTQSMTDAAAFTKEQKASFAKEHAEAHGVTVDALTEADHVAAVKAKADEAREKRFQAIMSGTVGLRVATGPRLDPLTRAMREIAEEGVRKLAAQKGVAMPKGDVLKAAIEKVLERNRDNIKAEAERRLSAPSADGLDDIL